jgi:cytosine/adenosine deaminase-related metal-dependent hydrolase
MQWPDIGRIREGALADLVIIDRDPLTVTAQDLAETRALRTIVDGAAVYDDGSLRGGPMAMPRPAADIIAEAFAPAAAPAVP